MAAGYFNIPYVAPVAELLARNRDFRRVLHTGPASQLVMMRLRPGEQIGPEVHQVVEQTFLIVSGRGELLYGSRSRATRRELRAGDLVMVHPGTAHNVANTSRRADLVILTWYVPPNHPDHTVHHTRRDAERDRADAAFSAAPNRRAYAAPAAFASTRRNCCDAGGTRPNPTLLKKGQHRYFFYSNEGEGAAREPPHVHVETPRGELKFWLRGPGGEPELADNRGGVSKHEIKQVYREVVANAGTFEKQWNKFFGG